MIGRAAYVVFLLAMALPTARAQSPSPTPAPISREDAVADFDHFWSEISDGYAYFHDKHISWAEVRAIYRPKAAQADTKLALLGVLESSIAELYDDHATMGADAPGSPRIVPSRTDLWASWHGKSPVIDEVRAGSEAARSGVCAGDEVVSVNGLPVADAVRAELPRTLSIEDATVRDWALRRVLAGRRSRPRRIVLQTPNGKRSVELTGEPGDGPQTLLEHRRLPGGFGYVRLHDSLGHAALVPEFDRALAELRDAPALILDLRDTPGGGSNEVAEPILGRFIDRHRGYQRFVVKKASWQTTRSFVQTVHPRGPFTYRGPLIVLVDHWTASMGEGVAVGFAAMHRATVVGTSMAGLNGGVYTSTLRYSGIRFNYPAERIYTLSGTPRQAFQPDVIVSSNGCSGDPVLERAISLLTSHTGNE